MSRSEITGALLVMVILGLAAGFVIGLSVNHGPEPKKPESRTVTVQKTVPGPERTVERTVPGKETTVERTVKEPCVLPPTGGPIKDVTR